MPIKTSSLLRNQFAFSSLSYFQYGGRWFQSQGLPAFYAPSGTSCIAANYGQISKNSSTFEPIDPNSLFFLEQTRLLLPCGTRTSSPGATTRRSVATLRLRMSASPEISLCHSQDVSAVYQQILSHFLRLRNRTIQQSTCLSDSLYFIPWNRGFYQ